jgi:hypothetical protein
MVTSTIALALETMIDRRLKRPNQWRARQQLARCRARYVTPRRATNATRLALVWLAHWFDWRQALAVVQPVTFLH